MAINYIYGIHTIKTLLQTRPEDIYEIYSIEGRRDVAVQELINLASEHKIKIHYVDRQNLTQRVDGANHQGVVAVIAEAKTYSEIDLLAFMNGEKLSSFPRPVTPKSSDEGGRQESSGSSFPRRRESQSPFLLLLDGVEDPHNLGACLRTANAAGVDAVIIPKDKSVGLTSAVRKVACGAAELTPLVVVTNLVRTMQMLQERGVWFYGADMVGESELYQLNFSGGVGLVLGAEGKGLRRLTRENCDHLFKIPMLGQVESLNVSVAAAISLYEVVRQRNK